MDLFILEKVQDDCGYEWLIEPELLLKTEHIFIFSHFH